MHDESKGRGIGLRYAIERHHRDDHEMPRACSIRSGYDDSQADGGKGHQCLYDTKLGREGEAEEGNLELKEIAHPYTYSTEQEQSFLVHGLKREQSIDEAAYHLLYPNVEGRLP